MTNDAELSRWMEVATSRLERLNKLQAEVERQHKVIVEADKDIASFRETISDMELQVDTLTTALRELVGSANRILEIEDPGKNYIVPLAECVRQRCNPLLEPTEQRPIIDTTPCRVCGRELCALHKPAASRIPRGAEDAAKIATGITRSHETAASCICNLNAKGEPIVVHPACDRHKDAARCVRCGKPKPCMEHAKGL